MRRNTDLFRELLSREYQEDDGEDSVSGVLEQPLPLLLLFFPLMYRLNVTGAEDGGIFPSKLPFGPANALRDRIVLDSYGIAFGSDGDGVEMDRLYRKWVDPGDEERKVAPPPFVFDSNEEMRRFNMMKVLSHPLNKVVFYNVTLFALTISISKYIIKPRLGKDHFVGLSGKN